MLGVLAGFAFFNKPSFMGVKAGQVDIETAVMGASRPAASRKRRGEAGDAAPAPSSEPATAGAPSSSTRGASGGRRTSTSKSKRKKRR